VSAASSLRVQRSPTDCGASRNLVNEEALAEWGKGGRGCCATVFSAFRTRARLQDDVLCCVYCLFVTSVSSRSEPGVRVRVSSTSVS